MYSSTLRTPAWISGAPSPPDTWYMPCHGGTWVPQQAKSNHILETKALDCTPNLGRRSQMTRRSSWYKCSGSRVWISR